VRELMPTLPTLSWSGLTSWASMAYRSGSRAGTAAFKSRGHSMPASGGVDWQRHPGDHFTITAWRSTLSLGIPEIRLGRVRWPSPWAYGGEDAFVLQTRYTLTLETTSRSSRPALKAGRAVS